jgi:uncharacterized membrane protein YbhN (UPF0104 family)
MVTLAEGPAAKRNADGRRFGGVVIRLGIAAALLYYLFHAEAVEWRAFARLQTTWPIALLGFAGVAAANAIVAARLPLLLRIAGFEMKLHDAVRLALVGLFFGMFLPGSASGDAAKIYYVVAGRERGTRAGLATQVLLDRAIGFAAAFAAPLAVVPFFARELAASPGAMTLTGVCAAVFATGGLALALVLFAPATLRRVIPDRWQTGIVVRSLSAVRLLRRHPRALATSFALSLLAQFVSILAFGVLAYALGFDQFAPMLVVGVPLGFVANALPLTPGGLGIGEVAFHRLFSELGLRGGAEALVGWRLCMAVLGAIGGVVYVRGRGRFITPIPAEAES